MSIKRRRSHFGAGKKPEEMPTPARKSSGGERRAYYSEKPAGYKRIATILVETELLSDKEICAKWKISPYTLSRYRRLLNEFKNPWIQKEFKKKWDVIVGEDWAKNAELYINQALDVMNDLSEVAREKGDPRLISQLTESIKVVGELLITKAALNVAVQENTDNGCYEKENNDPPAKTFF